MANSTNAYRVTQNYFDPFGRVFHTKRDGLRASWTGRDDVCDAVEEDVFRSYLTTSGTLHGHDRFGNRVATTNALGDAVRFAYDANRRLAFCRSAADHKRSVAK